MDFVISSLLICLGLYHFLVARETTAIILSIWQVSGALFYIVYNNLINLKSGLIDGIVIFYIILVLFGMIVASIKVLQLISYRKKQC